MGASALKRHAVDSVEVAFELANTAPGIGRPNPKHAIFAATSEKLAVVTQRQSEYLQKKGRSAVVRTLQVGIRKMKDTAHRTAAMHTVDTNIVCLPGQC